jgi:hypothetical protein
MTSATATTAATAIICDIFESHPQQDRVVIV